MRTDTPLSAEPVHSGRSVASGITQWGGAVPYSQGRCFKATEEGKCVANGSEVVCKLPHGQNSGAWAKRCKQRHLGSRKPWAEVAGTVRVS